MKDLAATLPPFAGVRPRTVTDQVFDLLYERVVNLALEPGARLSEAEVAAQMGISRQPVRDAFYRLSQMGFLLIRPQRATTVAPLSEEAVLQAYFIRRALEEACVREAAARLGPADFEALAQLIERQEAAVAADDRKAFHTLDDDFHREICERTGRGFVWSLVKENKGHMDRARFLSLSFGAAVALAEHRIILEALEARDGAAAAAAVHQHLSRIEGIMARLRVDMPQVFG